MPEAQVLAFPSPEQLRLQRALAQLRSAQALQADALAQFRHNIAALRNETARLNGSIHRWRDEVQTAHALTEKARTAVGDLQRTAARM